MRSSCLSASCPSSAASAPSRSATAAPSSASGRRAPSGSRCASTGASTRSRTPATASTRPTVEAAPGATTRSWSTATSCPTRARRWQPEGLRGPSRLLDTAAFEWTDDGWAPPGIERPGPLRAARRHLHARGHVRGRDPAPARPARARRHGDRADAGRRVPRPPRLGLRRRLPVGRAVLLRRPGRAAAARRRRPRRGPRGAPRRRLQPRRRLRREGAEAFGPYFTDALRDAVGRGDQLRRRATPTPSASGRCRAPSTGCATSTSTACGSTRCTRSRTPTPSTWSRPCVARARRPRAS